VFVVWPRWLDAYTCNVFDSHRSVCRHAATQGEYQAAIGRYVGHIGTNSDEGIDHFGSQIELALAERVGKCQVSGAFAGSSGH
jgi:hypothetical protein